jgi:TonB family protein
MTLVLDSTMKVSLVVLVGLSAASLLRGRSAALRHWVLAATVLCALVTPVLELVVPSWGIAAARFASATSDQSDGAPAPAPGVANGVIELSETVNVGAPAPPPLVRARDLLTSVWIGGAIVSLLLLAIGLTRLVWLAVGAQRVSTGPWAAIARDVEREYGLKRKVRLLQSDHPSLLVTWGLIQPRVIFPSAAQHWSEDRIRIVLRHELAHIRRGDWVVQLAGELLRAAYWFNPILWIACARLRLESEQACDDEVLSGGVDGPEYATQLLELARALKAEHAPRLPAPAVARSSSLERRIRAMLDARLTRKPTTRSVRFLTGAALLSVTVAVAAAQTGPVTLSGTVYDSSGAPVPDATIVLTHSQSQAKYEVKSSPTGYFEFVPLPADNYVLAASLPGFKKAEQPVSLSGKSVNRDLRLSLGELMETITVRGPANGEEGNARSQTVERQLDRSAFQRDLKACEASVTGGRVRPPRKIKDVRPVYPAHLRATGVTGEVHLSATIAVDGTVREATVIRSAHPDLDASAVDAVKQWQFDGTLLNCVAVEVVMKVGIDFGIQ